MYCLHRYSLRAGFVLLPLMALTAVFAFLSANNAAVFEFRYLFIAFACLQSVFIIIAYVLLSKEVCVAKDVVCIYLSDDRVYLISCACLLTRICFSIIIMIR